MNHVMRITKDEFDDIVIGQLTCVMRKIGKLFMPDDRMIFYYNGSDDTICVNVINILRGEYYNKRGLKKGYSIINFKISYIM